MSKFDHERICKGCQWYNEDGGRYYCTNTKKFKLYEHAFKNKPNKWYSLDTLYMYLDGDGSNTSEYRIQDLLGEDESNTFRLKKK